MSIDRIPRAATWPAVGPESAGSSQARPPRGGPVGTDGDDAAGSPASLPGGDEDEHTGTAEPRPVSSLPGPVRDQVISWAADALGAAAPADIPASLVRIARFAPAKRARVAGQLLGEVVQTDAVFRSMVAEYAAGDHDDDPVAAAGRAYLLRSADEDQLVDAIDHTAQETRARQRVPQLEAQVRRLTGQVERMSAELEKARASSQPDAAAVAESERLKLRLRAQGTRIRGLQDELSSLRERVAEESAHLEQELSQARSDALTWRRLAEEEAARVAEVRDMMARMRSDAGDRRTTADRRVELLLGALEGAAAGLRRELDLVGGGADPADVVAARWGRPGHHAERTMDPSRLAAWLALPGAHVIVDGYNVTKTGYPELSLADQRDRLIRSLAALSARTSAEATVVFDGAAVSTPRPPGRGIRVLFSPPGVIADDVIGDLVRGEPVGRVVIVVSSDRQVSEFASRRGARTAPSATLLELLG